jgi:malonyl CoA-acyl carrier protein transacylase
MGPWAPVAGGLLGLVLGVVAVLLLSGTAESFEDRLALVFAVLGLGMLSTAGILLADEIQMIRQCARDAVVRPQRSETMSALFTGLTPARLLLLVSAFVLFLAAFVGRG